MIVDMKKKSVEYVLEFVNLIHFLFSFSKQKLTLLYTLLVPSCFSFS